MQFARGYSNDTVARMVSAVKWAEARRRVSEIDDQLGGAVERVSKLLDRELSLGTVEQLDELLVPAVRNLRDAWEQSQQPAIVETGMDGVYEVDPPDLIELRRWLAIDGLKGHWNHNITAAEYWGLEVDARHRDIAFLLKQVLGGNPHEGQSVITYFVPTRFYLPRRSTLPS